MISFDTNVLLYAADGRDPLKQRQAIAVLAGSGDGVTLWQVACEYIAASRKLAARGLTPAIAWDQLHAVLGRYPLRCPAPEVLPLARSLHVDTGLSLWDAMIFASASHAGVKCMYTEDAPGVPDPLGIQVINPFRID